MRRLKKYTALFTLVDYLFKSTSDGVGMKQRHVSCCEDCDSQNWIRGEGVVGAVCDLAVKAQRDVMLRV